MLAGTRCLLLDENRRLWEASQRPVPLRPKDKEFRPKYNLPVLKDYSAEVFPESFWSHWKKKSFRQWSDVKSWVDPEELRDLARRAGYPCQTTLDRVCLGIEFGFNTGASGRSLLSTDVQNSSKVATVGPQMAEAIQSWIMEDPPIVLGPLRREELPWAEFKVNPLGMKLRYDGKVRPLVDASAPRDRDASVPGWLWSPDFPGSLNSTIMKEDFPTEFSSTAKFVTALHKVGKGAIVMKKDLVSAFKHFLVNKDCLPHQVIRWGGRYFVELALMFGVASSPSIFWEGFRLFVVCIIQLSAIDRSLVEQHLDDILGIGQNKPEDPVHNFHRMFLKEATQVGFRPDVSANKEKNQAPETTVIALGVFYDTESWTWKYNDDKLAIILNALADLEGGKCLTLEQLRSLSGKLNSILFMLEGAKFNICWFYHALREVRGQSTLVQTTEGLKEQAGWWKMAIMAARSHCPIRHPVDGLPGNYDQVWTDAAGGTYGAIGPGCGAVHPRSLAYAYLPWPQWINNGLPNKDGVRFDKKLTMLETLGALVGLITTGKDAMSCTLVIWVDNMGTVGAYAKGYSMDCPFTNTLVKAIYDVARGMGVQARIRWIRRCSDKGSTLADLLSKGTKQSMEAFRNGFPHRRTVIELPLSLISWLKDPKVDGQLGQKILCELKHILPDIVIDGEM